MVETLDAGEVKVDGFTMSTQFKVEYIRHLYVYDTKEALVSPLEFALVKDLNSNY